MEGAFAFLVHPRDITDIYRPYPFFKYLPSKLVLALVRLLPPIRLSKIEGIRRASDGTPLDGYLLSIVLGPEHMNNRRGLALAQKRIAQEVALAEKLGVERVGLGALIPSLTRQGKDLVPEGSSPYLTPSVTTGHTLTAWTIGRYLERLIQHRDRHVSSVTVAIVGAAGSTGSLTAKILARKKAFGRTGLCLLLIDLKAKKEMLNKLVEDLGRINPSVPASISTDLHDLQKVDYAVTVTNAPGAVVRPQHVSKGLVIVDDSQPRNTSPELVACGVTVIDVLSKVPGLQCNFDFGFIIKDPEITFTCLAETVLLASQEHQGHFSLGYVELPLVDELERLLESGAVKDAPFHSFTRELSADEVKALLAPRKVQMATAV
ncbi:MAG: hypothetical protein Q8Q36_00705 [bacterium]|nr:hypothetical protein [bacterium]